MHLPIHAAGAYNLRRPVCFSDYFVSSYTPTLGALIHSRSQLTPHSVDNVRLLLAGVSGAHNWTPLPYARTEIDSIRAVVPPRNILDVSLGEDTSRFDNIPDVLKNLPDAAVLHLACHGYHDPASPLDSGFVMQDGMLTIEKLMSLNLPNAFLAFLSACETARSNKKQPDQAVNLASTMLFAGFKSVIGTMWCVEYPSL